MYAVFRTQQFEKELNKILSRHEQDEIGEYEKKQLTTYPHIGDSLGPQSLREKKIDGKRVYFLVYEAIKAVLMVRVSTKKNQQDIIDDIREQLELYEEQIKRAIRQHGGFFPQQHP